MNERTITLPADTIGFSIQFAGPSLADQLGLNKTPMTAEPGTPLSSLGEAGASATGADTSADVRVLNALCSADDIHGAIASDERFTERSLGAIQKYLADTVPTAVMQQVQDMLATGELTSRVRRSGETVYGAS